MTKYNENPFPIEFKSIYQAILENVFKGENALFKLVQTKAKEYLKRRVMPFPDFTTVRDVISLVNAKMTLLSKMEAVKEESIARDRVVSVIVESMVQAFTNAIDITVRPEVAD